jgi:hypothetical protein
MPPCGFCVKTWPYTNSAQEALCLSVPPTSGSPCAGRCSVHRAPPATLANQAAVAEFRGVRRNKNKDHRRSSISLGRQGVCPPPPPPFLSALGCSSVCVQVPQDPLLPVLRSCPSAWRWLTIALGPTPTAACQTMEGASRLGTPTVVTTAGRDAGSTVLGRTRGNSSSDVGQAMQGVRFVLPGNLPVAQEPAVAGDHQEAAVSAGLTPVPAGGGYRLMENIDEGVVTVTPTEPGLLTGPCGRTLEKLGPMLLMFVDTGGHFWVAATKIMSVFGLALSPSVRDVALCSCSCTRCKGVFLAAVVHNRTASPVLVPFRLLGSRTTRC